MPDRRAARRLPARRPRSGIYDTNDAAGKPVSRVSDSPPNSRRGIPPRGVAPRSHIPDMLIRRALRSGRRARDFVTESLIRNTSYGGTVLRAARKRETMVQMRRAFVLACVLFASAAAARAQIPGADAVTRVLVLPFENGGGDARLRWLGEAAAGAPPPRGRGRGGGGKRPGGGGPRRGEAALPPPAPRGPAAAGQEARRL